MGPRRCNIAGCKSIAGRQQHRGVTFHTFPTNPVIRQNWLTNCRFSANKTITKSVLICSRHFRRVDFQPLKNNKYLLKPGSEPTIFPWTQSASTTSQSQSNSSSTEASSVAKDAGAIKLNVGATTSVGASKSVAAAQPIGAPAAVAKLCAEERVVNQIVNESVRNEMKSPMKRSASADVGPGASSAEPKVKQSRKSLDSAMFKKSAEAAANAASSTGGAAGTNSSDPTSLFSPGADIEAQDFKGVWHPAQVLEVDHVDQEVLIHFDTTNIKLIDEWIPMNSSRLRALQVVAAPSPPLVIIDLDESTLEPTPVDVMTSAVSHNIEATVATVVATPEPEQSSSTASTTSQPSAPLPLSGNLPVLKKAPYNYVVGEKCMAKWTDSRRWRATVQSVLELDYYDVLFDDGYTKRCHAKDMSKIKRQPPIHGSSGPPATPPTFNTTGQRLSPSQHSNGQQQPQFAPIIAAVASQQRLVDVHSPTPPVPAAVTTITTATTTKTGTSGRKVNPPLPIPKFDLTTLNLLPVPKDGEWCCNWVNDTPIGGEGFLEGPDGNRRPTVLVEDWRLPNGWTKHLYQRSSVSGKWDVVLVGPSRKRFRSKNDVKVFLDEHGMQYNPDVYDFSIHKRRAKDLGLFVFTDDYKQAQKLKQQQLMQRENADQHQSYSGGLCTSDLLNQSNISNISTEEVFQGFSAPGSPTARPLASSSVVGAASLFQSFAVPTTTAQPFEPEEDFVYIGTLKVKVHNNLFCCPEPSCNKNFRKESHLQLHIKHYHDDLAKQVGECLNMAELAYLRTTGELPPPEESTALLSPSSAASAAAASASHKTVSADVSVAVDDSSSGIGGILIDATDGDFQLDVSHSNRTSTPIKSFGQALLDSGPSAASTSAGFAGAARQSHAKKYKKSAKNAKSRYKLKIKTRNVNVNASSSSYTKVNRSVRQHQSSLAERYDDYDLNDDGGNEYLDSDYVPEGSAGSGSNASHSTPAAQRSNRLKFLSHPPVLGDRVTAASADPNAVLQLQPQSQVHGTANVFVDENGDVIKLVRMRQEEIINCVCLYSEEDGLMIQCELCLTWQHGRCQGFEKESAVPDKYVCYICQNPQSGRPSMRFVHDQEWLYEGRLPVTNQPLPSQQQQLNASSQDENASLRALAAGSMTPNATMGVEVLLPKHRERFEVLKHSHQLTGNLLELKRLMHTLQVKINIAENKDHPKMYLWARKWEKSTPAPASTTVNATLTGGAVQSMTDDDNKDAVKLEPSGDDAPTIDEVQVINDLMSNADAMKHIERAAAEIAKTEIKTELDAQKTPKQEDADGDGHILAGLLTSPGGTNIDLVGAVTAVEKREHQQHMSARRSAGSAVTFGAPVPEAAIDPVQCQRRLLEHIQRQQTMAMTRLQSIEADIIGLEAMDEHAEPVDANDNFGSTKRLLFQMLSDLTKIRKLAAINVAENELLNARSVPPPCPQTASG